MIETVEGNAGTVVPSQGYLTAARKLCTQYNVLFIADEIQCGFGRTGYFMAYDCENIKPDIVVLGKSLTGGAYSMGLTLGSREVVDTFKAGQYVFHIRFIQSIDACCKLTIVQIRLNVRRQSIGMCVRHSSSGCCH
jgi:acetylornithine/succinyldiaminopimelate/putrescine aminotransferase